MIFFSPIMSILGIYVLAAVLPAFFLLRYIYKMDMVEKEPAYLLWSLLLAGVLAALASIVLENIGSVIINSTLDNSDPYYYIIFAFLVVAVVEEGTKLFFLKLCHHILCRDQSRHRNKFPKEIVSNRYDIHLKLWKRFHKVLRHRLKKWCRKPACYHGHMILLQAIPVDTFSKGKLSLLCSPCCIFSDLFLVLRCRIQCLVKLGIQKP